MNKRLSMLEQLLASGKADSFARYALALEYRKEGRTAEAVACFDALRAADASYLPMYLMAGQTLLEAGRPEQAADWLREGALLARARGDGKTLGELENLLAELPIP